MHLHLGSLMVVGTAWGRETSTHIHTHTDITGHHTRTRTYHTCHHAEVGTVCGQGPLYIVQIAAPM